jgi:hypothetical protein
MRLSVVMNDIVRTYRSQLLMKEAGQNICRSIAPSIAYPLHPANGKFACFVHGPENGMDGAARPCERRDRVKLLTGSADTLQ